MAHVCTLKFADYTFYLR